MSEANQTSKGLPKENELPPSPKHRNLKAFIVALFLAFAPFIPYVAQLTRSDSRYFLQFSPGDLFFVLAMTLILGLFFFGCYRLGHWLYEEKYQTFFRRLVRFCSGTWAMGVGLILVAWAFAILERKTSFVPRQASTYASYAAPILGLIFGCLAASDLKVGKIYRKVLRMVCLIVSPLILVSMVSLGMQPDLSTSQDFELPASLPQPDSEERPLFIFVFDMWDYRYAFESDKPDPRIFRASAPYFEDFAIFTNAQSPSNGTLQSLPSILYQNDYPYQIKSDGTGSFDTPSGPVASQELPSIFKQVHEERSPSYVVGIYHNYEQMLGDQVDVSLSQPLAGFKGDLQDDFFHFIYSSFVTTALSQAWTPVFGPVVDFEPAMRERMIGKLRDALQATKKILRDGGKNSIALIHLPIPHPPFIYGRHGVRSEGLASFSETPQDLETSAEGLSNYQHNLAYLDEVIAAFMKELQDAGRYERSTIVFTSDHGARKPGKSYDDRSTHVPLMVKLPFQEKTGSVQEELVNSHVLDWIRKHSSSFPKNPFKK